MIFSKGRTSPHRWQHWTEAISFLQSLAGNTSLLGCFWSVWNPFLGNLNPIATGHDESFQIRRWHSGIRHRTRRLYNQQHYDHVSCLPTEPFQVDSELCREVWAPGSSSGWTGFKQHLDLKAQSGLHVSLLVKYVLSWSHTSDKETSLGVLHNSQDHSNHLNTFQISSVFYLSDYQDLKINDRYVWVYALGWMMTFFSAIREDHHTPVLHNGKLQRGACPPEPPVTSMNVSWWFLWWLCWFQRLAAGCCAFDDPGWKKIPEEMDGANLNPSLRFIPHNVWADHNQATDTLSGAPRPNRFWRR